jgi:hypothetical protein
MTNVEAYVESVKAKRAIEQAIKDEGRTPSRDSALLKAKNDAINAYGKLSGREAWLADRMLPKKIGDKR